MNEASAAAVTAAPTTKSSRRRSGRIKKKSGAGASSRPHGDVVVRPHSELTPHRCANPVKRRRTDLEDPEILEEGPQIARP